MALKQNLKTPPEQKHFHECLADEQLPPYTSDSNIISLRPFLKEGHYNHVLSFLLTYRPKAPSREPFFLSITSINQHLSPILGMNRTSVIRQLQALASESILPSSSQNPYIVVKEVGEKKKGRDSNRGFLILFKGEKPKHHVTRYFNPDITQEKAHLHASTAKQVLAAYEHEAERLEAGHSLKRLSGKDLASRIGESLSTIRRAQKYLFEGDLLEKKTIEEEFKYTHYNYEDGKRVGIKSIEIKKRFRVVYRPTKIHSQNSIVQNDTPSLDILKPSKIEDFTKGSLNSSSTSPVKSAISQKPSLPLSQFQNAWDAYCKIFTPKEGESLRQSLGAAKKYGVSLPTPERLMEALERSRGVSYLKLARRVGFCEAEKAELLAKGGALNDSSVHWKKEIQGKNARLGFLWILKHTEDILQGKYDRRELSEKAKGRVWGEDGSYLALNTPIKRREVPTEWFNAYLKGVTAQEDLRVLLMRLWKKFGSATYENLIDPCEVVRSDEGRWVLRSPNRFHGDLLQQKLKLKWWRVVYPSVQGKATSKMREAYEAWLQKNPQPAVDQKERVTNETGIITNSRDEKGVEEMGIVPANDDEGVMPVYVDDDAPHQSGKMPHNMGGRAESQDMEAHSRESEEALLKLRKKRQESLLQYLSACTNLNASEKALRIDTITRHGINAYNGWFNRCRIEIVEGVARYIAPNDFIAVEIERRYGVILEEYVSKGDEITTKRKKEEL